MLGEILIAIGLFVGFLGGFLLRLKIGMPTLEKRREAVNKLMKQGMIQKKAEDKVDKFSKILRKVYYSMIAIGALLTLFGGLLTALNSKGDV